MSEPALRREGDESPIVHVRWTDLNFHRSPDIFLPMVSNTAWKALCGILVEVWSEARHINKPNSLLMKHTGLKRTALVRGMRELEKLGIITCICDPEVGGRRIIQLNWTLRPPGQKEDRFKGRIVEPRDQPPRSASGTPPVPPAEPPPASEPLKELSPPIPPAEPPLSAGGTGGARPAEPPPVPPAEPPSSMRNSNQRVDRKQQEGPASSSCPDEEGTPTPAWDGGTDQVDSEYLDERLTPTQSDRIRRNLALSTGKPSPDLLDKLRRHDESVRRLGPLPEPERLPIVAELARSLALGRKQPASGPPCQENPGSRREEPRP